MIVIDLDVVPSLTDLRKLAASLNLKIETSENFSALAQPVKVGNLTAPNSLAVLPMEGCDGDSNGRPGYLTFRRYARFAAGGAGLLLAEAIAVTPEGRANPRQLWLHRKSKSRIARLVTRTREMARRANGKDHNPIIVAQLTHSGRYSKPEGVAHPLIPQRDPYRDKKQNLPDDWPVLTDDYLDKLQEKYVTAAKLAFEAGFDAVDIKACHGYLINEILACHTREGKYGGPFENRVRFILEVIDRIQSELGKDKMIASRLGLYDAIPYPYGWAVDREDVTRPDLAEPKRLLIEMIKRKVPLITATIGNPYYEPHYGRPYNEPVAGAKKPEEHPLVAVERIIRITGEIQTAFPDLAVVGAGYSWLRTWLPYVGAGSKKAGLATFIGLGRMAFAYPDSARDIVEGRGLDPDKVCVACSACTQIMRDGGTAGCVVRDNAVYGPIYERGRMSNRDNLARLAEHCRQCERPSCRLGCSAGVNIPKFIKKFLEGDDHGAYDVIRESNVFPEVCAWLCPVEQQCEGNCLNRFIGDGPLPIADIQRYLAEEANKLGWSQLRVPEKDSGRRVAVLGAGPAGLACAARLIEMGHSVIVFDKSKDGGGMITSAIPSERQESALKSELSAMFKDVPRERLRFRFEKPLSPEFTLDDVMTGGFDATFIGVGLPRSMTTAGKRLVGVWTALDFLRESKEETDWDLTGQVVAVIGGGNTAMDAAVTAKRLGATDVYIIYRRSFEQMPAWPGERDSAMKAGVHFLILTDPLEYVEAEGRLDALRLCPTRLGDADASGRRAPKLLTESAYNLPVDMVVEAIGQKSPTDLPDLLQGVEMHRGHVVVQQGTHQTSRDAVYAGGDLVRGPSTVVAAVSDGMRAAREIDEYLRKLIV
jgi:NADPH-dependent glutamate synthase beta subunit-like oxidoreductase/2,4-dienoyl-CoA reductase-like NADH-dependent reductase (Old Yellow Enzyme family)